eukprot:GHUV01032665.1.p1 GENE.GHUV01032665.1~~GHUV01032665.1.p1  ORF type:complete len:174 (-),score=32.07 GHUV01032665.1:69-590(-)
MIWVILYCNRQCPVCLLVVTSQPALKLVAPTSDQRLPTDPTTCLQACPEYTTTPDAFPDILALDETARAAVTSSMTMTKINDCNNIAGYGWQDGMAVECSAGTYSPGFNQAPCIDCGEGLTTARTAATGVHECQALPGWQLTGLGQATVCPQGEGSVAPAHVKTMRSGKHSAL